MSDTIVRGSINGTVSIGRFVVNDYTLTISEIDDGYRLTIERGSEVQTADLQSLSVEDIETIRNAEAGRVSAEELRVLAENARAAAETQRQTDFSEAIEASQAAAELANEVGNKLSSVDMTVTMLEPAEQPVAEVVQTEDSTTFNLSIPQSRVAYATFEVDPETMELEMHEPDRFTDISFELNDGNLEVVI